MDGSKQRFKDALTKIFGPDIEKRHVAEQIIDEHVACSGGTTFDDSLAYLESGPNISLKKWKWFINKQ